MLQRFNIADAPPKPDDMIGDWKCTGWDPVEQVSEWTLFEEDPVHGDKMHIRTLSHNTDAMLAANEAEFNAQLNDRWGDGKKVAHIPVAIWHGLGFEEALAAGDNGYIHKKLNDPDFRKLRTFKGQL